MNVFKGLESPDTGLVEEGIQAQPAGGDIRGGEREDVLTGSGLSAEV
ncbi:MAG: hypothetical protein LBD86_03095 [Spirochaetaceae bacterium]|nr:hypothetical protein [Spirochaetaceae bacterium]